MRIELIESGVVDQYSKSVYAGIVKNIDKHIEKMFFKEERTRSQVEETWIDLITKIFQKNITDDKLLKAYISLVPEIINKAIETYIDNFVETENNTFLSKDQADYKYPENIECRYCGGYNIKNMGDEKEEGIYILICQSCGNNWQEKAV